MSFPTSIWCLLELPNTEIITCSDIFNGGTKPSICPDMSNWGLQGYFKWKHDTFKQQKRTHINKTGKQSQNIKTRETHRIKRNAQTKNDKRSPTNAKKWKKRQTHTQTTGKQRQKKAKKGNRDLYIFRRFSTNVRILGAFTSISMFPQPLHAFAKNDQKLSILLQTPARAYVCLL